VTDLAPANAATDPANPTRYVTLAYGDSPGVYRQSEMMLVSLVAHAPEPREFVVATDRPECYVWFGTRVEIEYLSRERLDAWRGPNPFSMRQKLELLRTAWPSKGGIVFVDADVLAVADLVSFTEQLRRGAIFMHKREFVLSRSRRPGNRRLWAQLRALPSKISATAEDAMWNSGIIALPHTDRDLIDGALAMYDDLSVRGIRHFATEQLVESLVFARTGRLTAAEPWFAHYWGNKNGYDAEIARRLADAFIEGMSVKDAAAAYRARPIDLPVEVRPTRANKLRRWLAGRERR
jgi:hypothetical protein